MKTLYTLSVTDTGRTRVGVTRYYYGGGYGAKNHYFSELPPEERRRYFQETVSQVAQGARPVGGLTTKFDSYPGLEQFTVDVDNYAVVDGKYLYFDLPFTASLFPVGDDHRVLPLFISQGSQETIRTEITLPTDFHRIVIAPQSERLAAPGGTAKITSTTTADQCVITDDLETTPAIIAPADYPALLKVESALRRKSAKVFLLEKE
jgi:hypothetical protein